MSIIKTKCPSLSDLSQSIGPIDGTDSKRALKPLCDNIFDVQRSELVEVLERLRIAFWSDEDSLPIPMAILPPTLQEAPAPQTQPSTPQNFKRVFSEHDEDLSYQNIMMEPKPVERKRMRLCEDERLSKKSSVIPPSPKSLPSFSSLWPLKKSILRQIKTSNKYNEPHLLKVLTDLYQSKSTEQNNHLALYLIPVAKAMRRDTITKVLEQWQKPRD
ncbi:hypothetical protein INT47_002149 [Mucor saturninus]|uniref:Uncharacterized protein n=1 Tax=Mucor saturninus TaxID=64648 RepID=A0A8H7R297_9FUNG|nr:hypothetical protein INT47_002149 [Mucor saturninus]